MKNYSIRVTGKVQGVFFRKHTKETADSLGIKGTVRNEEDGSVLVELEGTDEQLASFIIWVSKGPEKASVEGLDIRQGKLKPFNTFEILR